MSDGMFYCHLCGGETEHLHTCPARLRAEKAELEEQLKTVLEREAASTARHDAKVAELEAQVAALAGALRDALTALRNGEWALVDCTLSRALSDNLPASAERYLKVMEKQRGAMQSVRGLIKGADISDYLRECIEAIIDEALTTKSENAG